MTEKSYVNKGGRPRLAPDQESEVVGFALPQAEKAELERIARLNGMSVSEAMQMLARNFIYEGNEICQKPIPARQSTAS